MTKHTAMTLLCVSAALIAAGCGRDGHRYRIGVSQCSDDEWRRQMNDEIRREALFHDDADVDIRTADDDSRQQTADIDYFTDHDYDLIIVSPREADSVTPSIKRAYESGIPVIVFDRSINGPYYTSYMELDNEGIGKAAARYAMHLTGDGPAHVIELRGLDGSSPAEERHRGFTETAADHPGLTITASVSGLWKGERAYELTDSLLGEHPETDIIYAHNDIMAIAASKAARDRGRDDIFILGTDAAPALGIKAVADSVIDATFVYPTEGERVIRTAMSILKGEPYPRVDHVPALYAVDRTNADILLRQNELLKDKTAKIEYLKTRNDMMRTRHNAQTAFLYAVAASALLLIMATAILLRYIRQGKRFQKILSDKNAELQRERDQQDELYERLEEAMNSKMAFFTNVSHDLRTPLTLIAEPAREVAKAGSLSPEHRTMMEIALRNVSILRRMIEQILDFRQLQNGHTILVREETDPARLVAGWTDAFRIVASKRHIDLELKTDTGATGATAALDVEKFERIFFNLLSNAFKFTPDNGRITVSVAMDDKELSLTVRDSGIGISRNDCLLIFDRFYKADRMHPTGCGIGLSLCKAFAEQMGGGITVESVPEKGSAFTVRIPVTHVGQARPSVTAPITDTGLETIAELEPTDSTIQKNDTEKPLLLIIDDNRDMTDMLRGILADNYSIITAHDGKSGMRLAIRYVPDLVICDIMMPVMDGLEFCSKIKTETTTSHIPVLMLTACHLDEQRIQSYDSGADGFISKPFGRQLLLSRCANLIENRVRIRNLHADWHPGDSAAPSMHPEYDDSLSLESGFYNRFLDIVRERYSDSELTVNDIAARLGIGHAQLGRKIKALTGMTPVDIIRNVRLRAARSLLLTTDRSISEIAYETGFSSPQYFSKCFRDHYSTTPTELRLK